MVILFKFRNVLLASVYGPQLIKIVVFSMERLDWRSSSGLAKCMGTIVSIAGASIVTFYKGPPIVMTRSSSNLSRQLLLSQQSNWVLGGLFLAVDCVLASSFLIIQVQNP